MRFMMCEFLDSTTPNSQIAPSIFGTFRSVKGTVYMINGID
ncbi:MAG: hypothetical protein ABIH00_07960 [Armatimonadota bacterium]